MPTPQSCSHFRVNTTRSKTSPVMFDFNVRTGAKLNKIAEEYLKKQMEEEALLSKADTSRNTP